MKTTISLFFTILILITAVSFLFHRLSSSINEVKSAFEKELGTTIIMDSDTLEIIDYSVIEETFTLSNGKKVSSAWVVNSRK